MSHRSTESENISLDAGLRLDGIPALVLWDVVIDMSHSSKNTHPHIKHWESYVAEKSGAQIPKTELKRSGNRHDDELSNVACCSHTWCH